MKEILERLKDDEMYYGEYGRQFLSNSDIYQLLNNPRKFRQKTQETKPMIEGRYFHTFMLEPEKIKTFNISSSASRNTKAYKQDLLDNNQSIMILENEANHIESLCSIMKSNLTFFDAIYNGNNNFEVPGIGFIKGEQWKGKADIINDECIIDLKTTSDISKFSYSAKKYNYDSQAYIYQLLFGVPVHFYVIDKINMMLGIYKPTESFLESGERKVEKAIQVYRQFFAEDSEISIEEFFFEEDLY